MEGRIIVRMPLPFSKNLNDRPEQTAASTTVTSNYRRRSLKPIKIIQPN